MKVWQVIGIAGAIASTGIYLAAGNRPAANVSDATVSDTMPEPAAKAVMPLLSAAVPKEASAGAETALAGPGLVTGSISGPLMARAEIVNYSSGMKLASLTSNDVAMPATRNASVDPSNDVANVAPPTQ